MSLRFKVLVPTAALVLLVAALFLATWLVARNQRHDGQVVNIAGRQRMLSQKMAKESLLTGLLAAAGHITHFNALLLDQIERPGKPGDAARI